MNVYKIPCTVWVRAESPEDAIAEVDSHAAYHFAQDNNMLTIVTDDENITMPEKDQE